MVSLKSDSVNVIVLGFSDGMLVVGVPCMSLVILSDTVLQRIIILLSQDCDSLV